ncbi:hypothetical protein PFISCL1PPCAC_23497, partial [Pristionchus fissidentatus]
QPSPSSHANNAAPSNSTTVNNGENNIQRPAMPTFPYGFIPNQVTPQLSPGSNSNNTAGGSSNSATMNNGENNPQRPGMPALPYGFFPNQMMPQPFPSFQVNPTCDPINGTFPQLGMPQMMPNMPMFNMNCFPQMPGMAPQMFNPMQFAPPGMNPFLPAGQSMPMGMMPPMNYVQYMLVPVNMMTGQPIMNQQAPIPVQIKAEPFDEDLQCTSVRKIMPMNGPNHKSNQPGPTVAIIKEEPLDEDIQCRAIGKNADEVTMAPDQQFADPNRIIKTESADSDIECVEVRTRPHHSFSMSLILVDDKDEVETESVDEREMRNSMCNSILTRASVSMDASLPLESPLHTKPQPARPSIIPEEIPDNQESTSDRDSPIVPAQRVPTPVPPIETASLAFETTRMGEARREECATPSVRSPPRPHAIHVDPLPSSHSMHSKSGKTPLSDKSASHESTKTVESGEIMFSSPERYRSKPIRREESTGNGKHTVAKRITLPCEKSDDEDIDSILSDLGKEFGVQPTVKPTTVASESQAPIRPRIPPRFPRKMSSGSEDERESRRRDKEKKREKRREVSRERSTSPWRYATEHSKKSKRRRKSSSSSSSSRSPLPLKKQRTDDAHSVIMKQVPVHLKEETIARYFQAKYGKCRVAMLSGGKTTRSARIVFESKKDRDAAYAATTHHIHSYKLMVFGAASSDALSEKKMEEKAQPMVPNRLQGDGAKPKEAPVIASSSSLLREALPVSMHEPYPPLKVYCGMSGLFNKDVLLSAGPIPTGCSLKSVVDYFRGKGVCVMSMPKSSPHCRQFLILSFSILPEAKKLLEADHQVDGHAIPVSPPYDVHVKTVGGKEEDMVETLEKSCGPLAKMRRINSSYPHLALGFLTFARPQDAECALQRRSLEMKGGGRIEIVPPTTNYAFNPFKEIWGAKLRREAAKMAKLKPSETADNKTIMPGQPDAFLSILTVGPIPDHLLKECDEFLLKMLPQVYDIPYPIEGRNFRLLTVSDSVVIAKLLYKGFIQVGEKQERILVSPSFDVTLGKGLRDYKENEILNFMQKNYGPIVRPIVCKSTGAHRVSFGRMHDALRVIADSPHLKTLQIVATERNPNTSFIPFVKFVDFRFLYKRAEEAIKEEQAENDRIQSERQDGEKSIVVSIVGQLLPDKSAITKHFAQFGTIERFTVKDGNHAIIQFSLQMQAQKALVKSNVYIGGRWIKATQYSINQ